MKKSSRVGKREEIMKHIRQCHSFLCLSQGGHFYAQGKRLPPSSSSFSNYALFLDPCYLLINEFNWPLINMSLVRFHEDWMSWAINSIFLITTSKFRKWWCFPNEYFKMNTFTLRNFNCQYRHSGNYLSRKFLWPELQSRDKSPHLSILNLCQLFVMTSSGLKYLK